MKPYSLGLLALVGAAAAMPHVSLGRSEGSGPSPFPLCDKSPNCESYIGDDGHWATRFKEDMGPGSEWFEAHVTNSTLKPRAGPQRIKGRQDEELTSECNEDVCSEMSVGGQQVNYGDQLPRGFADNLWTACSSIGCQEEFSAQPYGSGSSIPTRITLTGKPNGVFNSNYRWSLIWTMTEMVGRTSETYEYYRVVGRNNWGRIWNKAGNLYQINLYKRETDESDSHNLEAFLVFRIESADEGSIGCETIFGMLSAGIGLGGSRIGWAGAALGLTSAVCG